MKAFFAVVFAVALIWVACGSGASPEPVATSPRPVIVVTHALA